MSTTQQANPVPHHRRELLAPILKQRRSLSRWPLGAKLFDRAIGLQVPYAGTIKAQVLDLEPGYARVLMPDRRAVRNHLRSIHAVALINLGEMTANMALMSTQPADGRWIVTGLETKYIKKARGPIVALCRIEPSDLDWSLDREWSGEVTLCDSSGDIVARLLQYWKIGPKRS